MVPFSLGEHLALISFEQALRLLLDRCQPLETQRCSSVNALGKFLAESLIARHDSPSFDGSAVDGYGFSSGGVGPFQVVGGAEAGNPFLGRVGVGECVQILTGAVVPEGVDTIAMQEDCRREGDIVFIERPIKQRDNIRCQGEEYRAGTTLLSAGSLVTPPVIGLAVAQGHSSLNVGKSPRIAILTTGSELKMPDETLDPGMVYASNASTLLSAIRALGLDGEAAVLPDNPECLTAALSKAFETADLVLTTGGVSVGDRDYVRECALALGVEELFWKVAMKPGKPVFFGLREGKPMFGLPGNPVAAMVAFQVFVRPAILRLMGASDAEWKTVPVRLASSLRKSIGRTEFVRAQLDFSEGTIIAVPTAGQGSHMIAGMAHAEALLHLSAEREAYEEGEILPASLLKWGLL